MQASPSISTSGSPSWSVGTKQACPEQGNVLSATMQQPLPQQTGGHKDDVGTHRMEQQLQEERSRVLHLKRENQELSSKLSQLQQEHGQLESHCSDCKQVMQSQFHALSEKCNVIHQLQDRLARLQHLADAFAEEAHSCSSMLSSVADSYLPALGPPSKMQANKPSAATFTKPAVGNKDLTDFQDQIQKGQLQLPAAAVNLGRLLQQHHEQGSPVTAEAASTGARLQPQAPTIGSKRSRLCSATGSAGVDAAATLKRAASGGSGSSSSRQQLSGEEEPLDEGVGEVEPIGCHSAKRHHSPHSSDLQAAPAEGQAQAAEDEPMDADTEHEEKSQDDLEAAECLQALATSGAEAPAASQHSPMLRMPSNPLSVESLSSVMAAAAWAMGGTQPHLQASGAAGAGSNGSSMNPVLMATIQGYLQAAVGNQSDGFDLLRASQLFLPGQKQSSPAGYPQPQQVKQLHHQHHVVTAGPSGVRRPEGLAAGWGTLPKMGPASGGMAAPVRARKQSWFQTEIAEKIPVSVQQACARDWAAQQCMQVVCADLSGTFYVNSAGEYLIKLANSGEVVTPNKFEELAGKKTARNWQQSIRLIGYTMNGEPNSALLKLGHFTRIVGLVQDR